MKKVRKNIPRRVFIFLFSWVVATPGTAWCEPMSLSQFLNSSWDLSPIKGGEPYKNQEAEERIRSVRGKYLPHLSLDAIDSSGYPASNSALGVGGLMGSPFRSGWAGGAVVEQTIYDFGRIRAALQRAHAQAAVDQASLADEKLKFLSAMAQLYLICARARSVRELDDDLMKSAQVIQKETGKFTRTGQRSIVDNELVRIEVDDLALQQTQLNEYLKSLSEQMVLYSQKSPSCQKLEEMDPVTLRPDLQVRPPQLLMAEARRQEIESDYEASKARQLPLLNVMGSAGDMQSSRFVSKQDSSVGIGLVFPIWNGGEDEHRERSLRNQVGYEDEVVKAVTLDYDAWLKNIRDTRDRDQDILALLNRHVLQVQKTMDLATRRFFQLQGNLIDVRDAFLRLRTIANDKIEMEYALAYANLQLALLDTEKRH